MGPAAEDRLPPDYTAAVYGSLLVTTLVVIEWRDDAHPEAVALSLVLSIVTFWVAHVWAGIVNERVRGAVNRHQVRTIAVEESPMLAAVVLPSLALAATGLGVSTVVAIEAALILSLVQLFLFGLVIGRTAHSRWSVALAIATLDFALGLVVVSLKVVVIH